MTHLKHRAPTTDGSSTSSSAQPSSPVVTPTIEALPQTEAPSPVAPPLTEFPSTERLPPEPLPSEPLPSEPLPTESPSTESQLTPSPSSGTQLSESQLSESQLSEASVGEVRPANPSVWRKLGRTIVRYPNVSQMLLFLMLLSGTSVVFLYLLFQGAWRDRANNATLLGTILKMELAREEARVIEDSPEHVITHTFKTLDGYVAKDDWVWLNRFGSTVTYGKQEQRMIASCRPYSPLYIICNLSEIPQ